MDYQVAVLCADAVFARMLELEFLMRDLQVFSATTLGADDRAEIVLLDLDSAMAPPVGSYSQIIGFTRNSALLAVDTHRQCAMILHRPFELSLLRREVLAYVQKRTRSSHRKATSMASKPRDFRLDPSRACLWEGRREIPLTPVEYKILQCLLEHRGETVSREKLSELIGESLANKTEVYICYLRRKTDAPNGLRWIRTVRGKGYRIDE